MKKIMIKPSSTITVTIKYNKGSYPTTSDSKTPLNAFAETVLQSFNLLPTQFLLQHENTPIEITDTRPLSSLRIAQEPIIFSIIKRAKGSNVIHKTMITPSVIKVENFDNYQAIINAINTFMSTKPIHQNNFTKNKNNTSVSFTVPNMQMAQEFLEYIAMLSKKKYSLIGKPRVIIDQTGHNMLSKHNSSSNSQLKTRMNEQTISTIDSKSNSIKGNRSVTLPPIKPNNNRNNNRYASMQCHTSANQEANRNNFLQKEIEDFYSQQEFIRLSSPYVEDYDKRMKEYQNDKKNWVDKHGFYTSVGKYSMKNGPKYILNYVFQSPSEPPVNHQFRDIQKNQWINKKGFMLC